MKKSDALKIMNAFLREAEITRIPVELGPLAITFAEEMVDPEGWLFYFNTLKWVETKRDEYKIIGQGPTIVLADGRLLDGGSGESVSMVLKRFGVEGAAPPVSPNSGEAQ